MPPMNLSLAPSNSYDEDHFKNNDTYVHVH